MLSTPTKEAFWCQKWSKAPQQSVTVKSNPRLVVPKMRSPSTSKKQSWNSTQSKLVALVTARTESEVVAALLLKPRPWKPIPLPFFDAPPAVLIKKLVSRAAVMTTGAPSPAPPVEPTELAESP